jgi:phosphatidylglycerophosphate synthase
MAPPPTLPVKERDAVWTVYAIDPIAAPLVARLRGAGAITPNRLTVLSIVAALAAAVAFALGPLWAGAGLFQLSFLLDCMDGKLAAARGRSDPNGSLYDTIGDCIRLAACAAGLAVGLDGDPELGAALVAAYVGIRFSVIAVAEARPHPPSPPAKIELPARLGTFLRAAPRRSGLPGTTVDTEAVAFTLGPLIGVPVIGLAIAAAVDLLHLLVYVLAAVREAIARS